MAPLNYHAPHNFYSATSTANNNNNSLPYKLIFLQNIDDAENNSNSQWANNISSDGVIFLLIYLVFLPISALIFGCVVRLLQRHGLVRRRSAEALLNQCHRILHSANSRLTPSTDTPPIPSTENNETSSSTSQKSDSTDGDTKVVVIDQNSN